MRTFGSVAAISAMFVFLLSAGGAFADSGSNNTGSNNASSATTCASATGGVGAQTPVCDPCAGGTQVGSAVTCDPCGSADSSSVAPAEGDGCNPCAVISEPTALGSEGDGEDQSCTADVSVHKLVRTGPGAHDFVNGQGWEFSASPNADPSSDFTDSNGNAAFVINNMQVDCGSHDEAVSLDGEDCTPVHKTVTVTETPKSGYVIELVAGKNAVCTATHEDDSEGDASSAVVGSPVDVTNTENGVSFSVDIHDHVSCEFKNTPLPSSITVVKKTTNGVGGPFDFNVSGPNSTDEDLSATTSQANNPKTAGTVEDLFPGEYTITEGTLPAGVSLTGIDCGSADVETDGHQVFVTLGANEDVTCTYTNNDPVDLSIKKTTPAGDPALGAKQMTYNLEVTNNGPGENKDAIVVTDTLPTGLTYNTFSGAGWSCSNVASLVTCTHAGQLAVGAKSAVTITADIDPNTIAASTTNCANVTDTTTGDSNDQSCVTNNTTAVQVQAAEANQGLAFTGSNTFRMAGIALALLAAGLGFTAISRRRRNSELG